MTRRFLQWALRTPALRGARASVGRLAVAAIEAKHGTVVYFTEPERARILALFRKIRNETKTLLLEVEGMQLYEAVRAVRDIPGDIAEVGTYRGGSAKLMAEASGGAKQIHTFDTFEGLPATDALDASRFHAGQFATDADAVRAFLAPYPSVHVYEGMFPDTAGPIEGLRFSLVHLDVDLYQSTLESLRFFYPRMSPGGAIISHDYSNAEGVRQAFDEFFAGKPEPVLQLSGSQCLVLEAMTRSRSVIYFNSGAIGEFLMTLHFADAVHAADPETRVVIPVRRNGAMLAELARAYPNTDVISLGKEDLLRGLVRLWNISGVRIVLTQQTFGTHPFLLVALARMTAWRGGLQSRFLAFDDRTLLSRILAPSRWRFDLSSRFPEEMCRLASGLGFASECPQPRLRGVQVLPNAGPAYAVFHLRANIPARTPSMGAWRELILGARATWPEMPFLFSGSAADTDFIDAVIAGIPFCENIAARDTLPVLAGILANAALYVGPDTGITHLAAFVGTPSVVWGTRSTPCWWATYSPTVTWLSEGASCGCDGKKSSACRVEVEGEGKFRCLADVPATAVLATMVEQVRLS